MGIKSDSLRNHSFILGKYYLHSIKTKYFFYQDETFTSAKKFRYLGMKTIKETIFDGMAIFNYAKNPP